MNKIFTIIVGVTGILFFASYFTYHYYPYNLYLVLSIILGVLLYEMFMRMIVGTLINKKFQNHINYELDWFQEKNFESDIYKSLQVQKWKKLMPTYSPKSFNLKKHSFDQIIQSTCQSEIIHEIIIVLSFVPVIFSLTFGHFWIILVVSVLAALIDLTFVILQRYNRPRLIRIMQMSKKREERSKKKQQNSEKNKIIRDSFHIKRFHENL